VVRIAPTPRGWQAGQTCAVTTLGAAACWGSNSYGQLGDGTTTQSSVPVAVSGLSAGVASLSVRYSHNCAVTTAGAAKCWGDNYWGQLGNGTTSQRKAPVAVSGLSAGVASIASGSDHVCAVTTLGAAMCWGFNYWGQLGNNSIVNSLVPVKVLGQ